MSRTTSALLAGAGLLAVALSLIGITGRDLGFDEAATVTIVTQHGSALGHAIARDGGNMSGYYLLLHVLTGWFGDGPWVLRLPSALLSGLTPVFVGLTAHTLWEEELGSERASRTAVTAAFLAAVSLPLVYWGQTARGYAAMLGFACAAMWCLARLGRGGGMRWVGGWVLVLALAAYCGFIVLLLVPVSLLAILLAGRRDAFLRLLAGCVALGVLLIPIAVLALRRGSGQLFWVPRPSGQVDTQVLQMLTSSGLQSTFHRVFTTTPGWWLTAAVLLGLLAVTLTRRGQRTEWGTVVVLSWAIVPVVLAFAWSEVLHPVFLSRNLLISSPAVALVLGRVLAARRLPRWAFAGGVAVALLIRAVPVIAAVDVSPEPWGAASARVLAGARPGDCIAFYPEDSRNPVRWYAARSHALDRIPRSVLPAVRWSATTSYVELYRTLDAAQVTALRGHCTRMWLVSSHEGQPDGPAQSVRNRERWLTLRRRLERVFGAGPVASLGWASPIHVELMPGRSR